MQFIDDLTKLSDAELQSYRQKVSREQARYNTFQQARKICLNSAYGATGSQYFRYYDIRLAESVTLSGQLVLHWINNSINKYFNNLLKTNNVDYIIAGDTDSVYINMEALVKSVFKDKDTPVEKIVDFIDKYCKEVLSKHINKSFAELAEYLNAYQQKMSMKRECIADKALWTAKKNYILNVYDKEGVRYKEPKLNIKGLSVAKSTTPKVCKKLLKEAIRILIDVDEVALQAFVKNAEEQIRAYPIEEVALPKTCNNLNKYSDSRNVYKAKTPLHVRGALIFNNLIKEKKLTSVYPQIHEGEKIKYIFLKEPNPIGTKAICITNKLPTEFGLDKYIDYEMQFEKAFKEPLQIILDAIGWKAKKKKDLSSLFED